MGTIRPYQQTDEERQRTQTWRRRPMHVWRGRQMDTITLTRSLMVDAAAKRREAICVLMDQHDVENTERAHRHAYATLWTYRVRQRLGPPPRPATLVRWRRKRAVNMLVEAFERLTTEEIGEPANGAAA